MDVSFEDVLELQNQRDSQDTQRPEGGLRPAQDSIMVCTDGMSEDEVLDKLVQIVDQKRSVLLGLNRNEPLSNSR